MEKIFYAIMLSLFVSLISTPGLTCSRQTEKGSVTGAACSIAELNNMSKYKYAQENSVTGPPSARDLRPVKKNSLSPTDDGVGDCKLGLCIIEKIYELQPQ